MKYRRFRGLLALLLVLSLFVSFGALTAFALPLEKVDGTMFDSMNEIRAIIIFKETFDPRGGMVNGSTD